MTEQILWGDIDLTDPAYGLVEGAGVDFGAPVSLTTALARFLLDGEIVEGARSSNRTLNFLYHAKCANSAELAQLGERLAAQGRKKRSQIAWISDDPSNPTIFDTYRASVVRKVVPGDPRSLADFQISIPAMPFVHPKNRVLVEALPAPTGDPITENIDDCTSPTGWTGTSAVTVDDGSVSVTVRGGPVQAALFLSRAITQDMTDTPYVSFDVRMSASSTTESSIRSVAAYADDSRLEWVATQPSPIDGYLRVTFRAPPAVAATLRFEGTVIYSPVDRFAMVYATLMVTSVDRTNLMPNVGNTRQRFRTIHALGSQRTPARIQVTSETRSLGDLLLYTRPDDGSGYLPSLMSRRVAGGVNEDNAASVSGKTETLPADLPFSAEVPVASLPAGNYHLLAVVGTAGTFRFTWGARLKVGSEFVGGFHNGTVSRIVTAPRQIVVIDSLRLPPERVAGNVSGKVRISLQSEDSSVKLDDLLILEVDTGAYTIVRCGTGTPELGADSVNRVRVDPADSDQAEPTVLGGYAADWSDAHFVGSDNLTAWSDHPLEPGRNLVYTVSTNADDTVAKADYYPLYQDQVL